MPPKKVTPKKQTTMSSPATPAPAGDAEAGQARFTPEVKAALQDKLAEVRDLFNRKIQLGGVRDTVQSLGRSIENGTTLQDFNIPSVPKESPRPSYASDYEAFLRSPENKMQDGPGVNAVGTGPTVGQQQLHSQDGAHPPQHGYNANQPVLTAAQYYKLNSQNPALPVGTSGHQVQELNRVPSPFMAAAGQPLGGKSAIMAMAAAPMPNHHQLEQPLQTSTEDILLTLGVQRAAQELDALTKEGCTDNPGRSTPVKSRGRATTVSTLPAVSQNGGSNLQNSGRVGVSPQRSIDQTTPKASHASVATPQSHTDGILPLGLLSCQFSPNAWPSPYTDTMIAQHLGRVSGYTHIEAKGRVTQQPGMINGLPQAQAGGMNDQQQGPYYTNPYVNAGGGDSRYPIPVNINPQLPMHGNLAMLRAPPNMHGQNYSLPAPPLNFGNQVPVPGSLRAQAQAFVPAKPAPQSSSNGHHLSTHAQQFVPARPPPSAPTTRARSSSAGRQAVRIAFLEKQSKDLYNAHSLLIKRLQRVTAYEQRVNELHGAMMSAMDAPKPEVAARVGEILRYRDIVGQLARLLSETTAMTKESNLVIGEGNKTGVDNNGGT